MRALLFLAGLGLAGSTALGALPSNYTTVDVPGGDGSEPGILAIAQHIIDELHGGTGPGALFTNASQVNTQSIFSAGNWTLTRIKDNAGSGPTSLGNVLNISRADVDVSGITDQVMIDGIAAVSASARYAGFNQAFGFRNGASGGNTQVIANVTGNGYNATFGPTPVIWDASAAPVNGGQWRWARGGTQGLQASTLAGDNLSNEDLAITFRVYNPVLNYLAWIVAFEDKLGPNDYNDLVVLIQPQGFVVPLPHAGALAGVGLLGLAGIRRRKTL